MAFDGTARIEVNVAKQLHPNNGVDKEQHHHQHHDIRKGLCAKILDHFWVHTFFAFIEINLLFLFLTEEA